MPNKLSEPLIPRAFSKRIAARAEARSSPPTNRHATSRTTGVLIASLRTHDCLARRIANLRTRTSLNFVGVHERATIAELIVPT